MAGKKVQFDSPSGDGTLLSQPVYHSTAALGHQLKTLKQMEFDAEGTVLKALENSEMARINFAEKIAEGVNVSKKKNKYSGLVSVDVPVEATLAQEVEERLSRLNTNSKKPWRKPTKASDVPPPNIMNVFTPDLILEEPILHVPALTSQEIRAKPCSPESTFDLYRHMQCWDS
ncbi:protein phosphatase 1 regulatory subunit 35-like [Asterias amurensis]|uniref:protein phosphatase 1 regulatory subunit 35-like n=1 Tax=Asterias amurensis TaxID=7602 RepID=UPI003AB4A063